MGTTLLQETNNCPKCQHTNQLTSRFCTKCGSSLVSQGSNQAIQPKRHSSPWRKIGIGVAIFFGVIFVVSFFTTTFSEPTSDTPTTPPNTSKPASVPPAELETTTGTSTEISGPAHSVSCQAIYAKAIAASKGRRFDSSIQFIEHYQKFTAIYSGSCLGTAYTDSGIPRVITCEFEVRRNEVTQDCDW